MKKFEKLYQDIVKHGFNAKIIALTENRQGIMIDHDYLGMYPGKETFDIHHAVMNMAKKAGYKAEQRGHYTATLIYNA